MQRLSTFFTLENGLTNRLGVKQEVPGNKVHLYNLNYSASRLDLIKYSLDLNLKIVNWFVNDEVGDKLNIHPMSSHRKGLAVEFRVEGVNNRNIFELIKNKVLGKNTVKFTVAELIYMEETDTISISFKTNAFSEQNKIGIIETNKPFRWLYINDEKIVKPEVKKSIKRDFKKNDSRSGGYNNGKDGAFKKSSYKSTNGKSKGTSGWGK